ncbi:hypothetical protein [Candidatus Methanomassiliicoccus intestinalis]|uniref:hypothetical protein n=1 Tax=Candidatus Methanomassiliicoccus intestinalis TaxID=1406512 RepID=UPI0037DDC6DE
MVKNKVFCHNVCSNVDIDRAKTCLAFKSDKSQRVCGYCYHALYGSDDEMIIDLDSVFGD